MIQEVHQEKEDAEDALLTEKEIGLISNAFYYMNFYNTSAFSIFLLSLYKSNQNNDFVYTFRPHLVVDIVNFEPFVTRVTDMDATVKHFL